MNLYSLIISYEGKRRSNWVSCSVRAGVWACNTDDAIDSFCDDYDIDKKRVLKAKHTAEEKEYVKSAKGILVIVQKVENVEEYNEEELNNMLMTDTRDLMLSMTEVENYWVLDGQFPEWLKKEYKDIRPCVSDYE